MARTAKKIGMAVAIKTGEGLYPRHEIIFKNDKPWRCRLNADSPEIDIPPAGPFYATHAKGINVASPKTRATPLPGGLDEALVAFRQFRAKVQGAREATALISDFTTNQKPGERVLVQHSIEKYLRKCESKGLRKTSLDNYRTALKGFELSCSKSFVDELTQEDLLETYVQWMKKNLRKNLGNPDGQQNITYNKRLGMVNTWTETFTPKGEGLLPRKGWKLKVVKKSPDYYAPETIDAILQAATPEESLLLRFYCFTGCRNREIATAEYDNVDVKKNEFRVRAKPHIVVRGESWIPKTATEREQKLPPAFVKEIMERKAQSTSSLIFPARRSGKVDMDLIQYLKDAVDRAVLAGTIPEERYTLQKFRRTAITDVASKHGLPMAMSFAGHSNATTTNKYVAKQRMTEPAMADLIGARP